MNYFVPDSIAKVPVYSQCLKKVPHGTRKMAKDAATRAQKRFGKEQDIYKCQQCGSWHVYTIK